MSEVNPTAEHMEMLMGTDLATFALVLVGLLMTVLGMFGGPEYVVMGMGVVALIAAGLLGLVKTKAPSR